MDAKTKKSGISAIDIGIIFVVIACVCLLFYKLGIIDKIRALSDSRSATITFVAEKVSGESAGMFQVDSPVYVDGKLFGTVTANQSKKSLIYKEDTNGEYVSAESDSLYDIYVTVDAVVYESAKGNMMNGKYITPGTVLTVRSGFSDAEIMILSLSVASD